MEAGCLKFDVRLPQHSRHSGSNCKPSLAAVGSVSKHERGPKSHPFPNPASDSNQLTTVGCVKLAQ